MTRGPRKRRVTCYDGDVAESPPDPLCDIDRAADGVCTFASVCPPCFGKKCRGDCGEESRYIRLPDATLISVGHRPELEAFHKRKLVLEYHPEGARLVRDESLQWSFRRSARFLSRLLARERPLKAAASA